MLRTHLLATLGGLGVAFAIGVIAAAQAEQVTANEPAGRYAVSAGNGFGLVVDQATGTVWRCETVDVACDKLRLEE